MEVGSLEEKIYDEFVNNDWEYNDSADKERAYKIFYEAIEGLAYSSNLDDFSKEDIIEMLKEEIKGVKKV